jgi:predicted metal-dependent hydrolase
MDSLLPIGFHLIEQRRCHSRAPLVNEGNAAGAQTASPPKENRVPRHVLPGDPEIEIELRRSARARRYSLRVPSTGGAPVLTMPAAASQGEALAFACSRRGWLLRHLGTRPTRVRVAPGAYLPVEGTPLRIVAGTGRSLLRDANTLAVPGPEARSGARVAGWLKALARDRLAEASDRHAAALGRGYARLDLRDTRGRWGSCSSAGRLMYSWRLAMAPPEVLDYVAAHEVAHLAEMNHGPRFWATVARLYPGYTTPRTWLRTQGPGLHSYLFTDD